MPKLALPSFDPQACISSGWCITICPTNCIDMWNDRPHLHFPQACISCRACELVCPTKAIELTDDQADAAERLSEVSKVKQRTAP